MDVKEEPVDAVVISDDELCPGSKTIRGPNKKGSDKSAPFYEYGNTVAMDHYQVEYLKTYVTVKKPTKPLYICTLQESHVIKGKGKMHFSKSYTKKYLRGHLKKEVIVKVTHHKT